MTSSFIDWLTRVLTYGESIQVETPVETAAERDAILELLAIAFERHSLNVAGPPIAFDSGTAYRAAFVLARACWRLVVPEEDELLPLQLESEPSSPSAHLSADVTLCFLPAVYHRAAARNACGELVAELETLLRVWSLSGVLADLDGEPTTKPVFAEHRGLQLLYAERLARTGRPGWVPTRGTARELAERAFRERGKPMSIPLISE
jgi:hypothetical protein